MSLKELKEAFVTGHTGTTPIELLFVCAASPIGGLLYHEIRHLCIESNLKCRGPSVSSPSPSILPSSATHDIERVHEFALVAIESVTILLPMAICQSELLYPFGVIYLILELCLGVALLLFNQKYFVMKKQKVEEDNDGDDEEELEVAVDGSIEIVTDIDIQRQRQRRQLRQKQQKQKQQITSKKLEFLTFYRSTVSYLTFVAILAVDFTIFPRSFAKTEVYGYGLMDVGAASFMASGGFVSWFARSDSSINNKNDQTKQNLNSARMKKAYVHSIPLLFMGSIRLFSTKELEYQEHVSEYGVH